MCSHPEGITIDQTDEGCVPTDVIIDLSHGNYFVWDPVNVLHIRRHHRIVGASAGSLSWKPRQNACLGLPVQLSKFGAAYLLHNGLARLRDSSKFDDTLYSGHERQRILNKRKAQRKIQIELLQQQKATELDSLSPLIMQGKKVKRAKTKDHISASEDTGAAAPDEETEYESFKDSELQKTKQLGFDHIWVDMPAKSTFTHTLPFIEDHHIQFGPDESTQYAVFCDLRDQGFYVANGTKFGGDFLVYPGDPVCYHSFYIALCVPHDKKMSGYELSALGRLASTVKKTLLLCSKSERGHIEYLSISWTGVVP